MFTKKQFNHFARGLSQIKPEEDNRDVLLRWRIFVTSTSRMFQRSNPRFDENKFLKACNYP